MEYVKQYHTPALLSHISIFHTFFVDKIGAPFVIRYKDTKGAVL